MTVRIIRFFFRGTLISLELIFATVMVLLTYIMIVAPVPDLDMPEISIPERTKIAENHYVIGNNWLRKNEFGVWEMYIEGTPYERGLIYGKLSGELVKSQEKVFIAQIENLIPSRSWQRFLLMTIGFFNKDLTSNIPRENLEEIYGVSKSFSDDYDYISSKYARILNYHAAHDIGHALNDYSMVGCTSFALNGDKTQDHQLLVGRNFDFYMGDDFAKDKLILFVNPDKGYKFASYSWAGFTGVVSGLNEKGLSVTINAAKSDLPSGSKTPISIVAREILQYASTIDEAIRIAGKRETFVSETFMVSSKKDGKAVLIEKSPTKTGVYQTDGNTLICANHYQSETFRKDPVNLKNIEESDSKWRYARTQKLLGAHGNFTVADAIAVLRDQKGLDGDTLGAGNPKAINQLLAHHSVVFEPASETMWISTAPYQLGNFIAYDLKKVFGKKGPAEKLENVAADPFLYTDAYKKFIAYKVTRNKIIAFLNFGQPLHLSAMEIKDFIASNRELYLTYDYLGNYFLKKNDPKTAKKYYDLALTKTVASVQVQKELMRKSRECLK